MTKNLNMTELHNWLFHYNPYTESWAAFKRDDLVPYFNGDMTNVLKSKSQKTLEGLITYHNGDIKKINEVAALSK
jgi:hypothetical protein